MENNQKKKKKTKTRAACCHSCVGVGLPCCSFWWEFNGLRLPRRSICQSVAPQDFAVGDEIAIKVNKLSSSKNLPYDFYSLYGFCKPKDGIHKFVENLGEVLRGDRIENSVYTGAFRQNSRCQVACGKHVLTKKEAHLMESRIDDEYKVNMILDNLPVGMVLYHENEATGLSRIVGFEVEPHSVRHSVDDKGKLKGCDDKVGIDPGMKKQEVDDDEQVVFSYDIVYEPSDITWASRWDTYLIQTDKEVHWFSVINSLMIVLFLTETAEEAAEETGWKLVHGDVFRPQRMHLVGCAVGTGTQLLSMTIVTILFAALGFLSPANRGGLTTAACSCSSFLVFQWVCICSAVQVFQERTEEDYDDTICLGIPWNRILYFPVFEPHGWGQKSSGAVPFGTMIALIFLWFGVSVPLTFVGAYFGYRKEAIEEPVRTNKIPRQVPDQPWYMGTLASVVIGAFCLWCSVYGTILHLGVCWQQQVYYLFGILSIVLVILLLTCAEITIVLAYFQLCGENYKWWWKAFVTSGSSAFYIFFYSMFYFSTRLDITKIVPALMYFGYMFIVSLAFFALTGTVGFYACYMFIHRIYASVKID
eukprot:jgi/Picre1/35415/NNA_002877.t1